MRIKCNLKQQGMDKKIIIINRLERLGWEELYVIEWHGLGFNKVEIEAGSA